MLKYLAMFLGLCGCKFFTTVASAEEEILSDTYLPQIVVNLSGKESEGSAFYFCPCMRSMLFSNFNEQVDALNKKGRKSVFDSSLTKLDIDLPTDKIRKYPGKNDIRFTALQLRGAIGIDVIAPGMYRIRNRYLDSEKSPISDMDKSTYRTIELDQQATYRVRENGSWRTVVIDSYNHFDVGLHAERYDKLKSQGYFGWSSDMGYSNGHERGFADSIEVGGIEFKDVFVTRLAKEDFDVIGISGLRQRQLVVEVTGAHDLIPRLMKVHISEEFDDKGLEDKLFCRLFQLLLDESHGCLVANLEAVHPLAKYVAEGDVLMRVNNVQLDQIPMRDVYALLYKCLLTGGVIEYMDSSGINKQVEVASEANLYSDIRNKLKGNMQ